MATKILNKQRITSLKPKSAVFEVMDGAERGLGVRVSPTAKKVWIYRYRMAPTPNERAANKQGKLRRIGLGDWPLMDREAAVQELIRQRDMRKSGIDPLEARRATREALSAAADIYTVGKLVFLQIPPPLGSWISISLLAVPYLLGLHRLSGPCLR